MNYVHKRNNAMTDTLVWEINAVERRYLISVTKYRCNELAITNCQCSSSVQNATIQSHIHFECEAATMFVYQLAVERCPFASVLLSPVMTSVTPGVL